MRQMVLRLPNIYGVADYKQHFQDSIWQRAAAAVCERHGISYTNLRRAPQGEHIIFLVDRSFVLKIYAPFRNAYERERTALEFSRNKLCIETPDIIHAGEIEGWSYLIITQLPGILMRDVWRSIEERERIEIVSRLGFALNQLHAHAAPLHVAALNLDWREFVEHQARTSLERQRACGANAEWLESLPAFISSRLKLLPPAERRVLLHGDVHPGNVLLNNSGGRWQVAGLFDFSDSLCGFREYEFVTPGVLMFQGEGELQRAFLRAYGYRDAELDLDLRARLMLLTVLYECSDLRKYAQRLSPEAVHLTLEELEAAIWRFVVE